MMSISLANGRNESASHPFYVLLETLPYTICIAHTPTKYLVKGIVYGEYAC
jgi:hypothetical protein